MELHALTLAACSYALLVLPIRGVYHVYASSVGSISNLCHNEAANYHASFVQTNFYIKGVCDPFLHVLHCSSNESDVTCSHP